MLALFRFMVKFLFSLIVISVLCASYIIFNYLTELPDYSELSRYHPPIVSRVYSADGKLLKEFSKEHRIFVPIRSMPKTLINAFIAAEDRNFYEHSGIDVIAIIRAFISNILHYSQSKRLEGGSTITQQVVKNMLVTSERSIDRKIKEALLAYMISKYLSKDRILELYLNQMFFGNRSYGVGSAAQHYFNKSVEELTLEESAFIAGLLKSPSSLNVKTNYDRTKKRRDYVLERMYKDGHISEETYRAAIQKPIILATKSAGSMVSADYFVEKVKNKFMELYNEDELYTGGYTIITTLDSKIQHQAQESLRNKIRNFDQKRSYRGRFGSIKNLDDWVSALGKVAFPLEANDSLLAVILSIKDRKIKIGLKNGKQGELDIQNFFPVGKKHNFAIGDVVVVEPMKSKGKGADKFSLSQIPEVNGAIMVMHPQTGRVLGYVGGYDFGTSNFDRVSQAMRQPGSAIKPFVFLSGLEAGLSPNMIIDDAPVEIDQGPGLPLWRPKNYKGDFLGAITMRKGLEYSRNMISIRIAQKVGLSRVSEMIKRFGVNSNPPMFYSIVLGSLETSLEKMCRAYSIIANTGLDVLPEYIEIIQDPTGKVVYKRGSDACIKCNGTIDDMPHIVNAQMPRVIADDVNYQMISMLQGVVQRGTGAAASALKIQLAGKTGSTNDSKDAWFIGFTPNLLVGTYIGYDTPRNMGEHVTGATMALPIFIDFMSKTSDIYKKLDFDVPASIKLVHVDKVTGRVVYPPFDSSAILEAFRIDTDVDVIGNSNVHNDAIVNHKQHLEDDDATGELY